VSGETSTRDLESIVRLNMTRGVGARTFRKLAAAFGSAEGILKASANEIARVSGVSDAVAQAIANGGTAADAAAEMERAAKAGAHLVTIEDQDYPELLGQIYDPPLVLYVWGDLRPNEQAVAVVGTRTPTYYGQQQSERLANGLAARGFAIVAGLARGIDGHAHEGALAAGGRTIGVLGSGLLTIYPRENRLLAERVAANGAVISEFPMEAGPDPWNFPRRNRIISGISRGVVIVEAAASSGSLITASWAAEQNRLVFAVPGRVDSPTSAGCHALIRDGATLVEGPDDVLRELGSDLTREPGREMAPVIPADLSDVERGLLKMLDREPKHIDDLIRESGLAANQVAGTLVMLEIKKLAVQLPGKRFALP